MLSMRDSQLQMAGYLRNPSNTAPPAGIEARRLKIYRELVYNNIEGFVSSGFPVLRSLYDEAGWHALVQTFIDSHRCHTPYFLEISQEFVGFLMERYQPGDADPPFMAELAHYEWVELALDVAEEVHPGISPVPQDILGAVPGLSPLAWVLSYQFPVHHIGPDYRPESPGEPCYLVVYRDPTDRVQFMELSAASARLLERVRENPGKSAAVLLAELAGELGLPEDAVLGFGAEQLIEFTDRSIVVI